MAKSAAADFSHTSLMFLLLLHVQSPSVLLPLAALLLWPDSLPHCTDSPCRKRHKYWHRQNIGAKISLIFAKL
jgi:hypothetical protein